MGGRPAAALSRAPAEPARAVARISRRERDYGSSSVSQ